MTTSRLIFSLGHFACVQHTFYFFTAIASSALTSFSRTMWFVCHRSKISIISNVLTIWMMVNDYSIIRLVRHSWVSNIFGKFVKTSSDFNGHRLAKSKLSMCSFSLFFLSCSTNLQPPGITHVVKLMRCNLNFLVKTINCYKTG